MDVIMPQLGETVTEGTVANWYKKVGDTVRADEPLFDVETDKVTTEIPAVASGVLKAILVEPGTTVPVGTVLAVIEQDRLEHAACDRRDLGGHLVGLDVEERLVGAHRVADFLVPVGDGALGHRLAQLRHDHVHFCVSVLLMPRAANPKLS